MGLPEMTAVDKIYIKEVFDFEGSSFLVYSESHGYLGEYSTKAAIEQNYPGMDISENSIAIQRLRDKEAQSKGFQYAGQVKRCK